MPANQRRGRPAADAGGAGADALGSRYTGPDMSPGFVLWRVATVWQRAVRAALDEVGLTHAQFVLLVSAAWLEAQATEGRSVTQARISAHARTDVVMTSEVLRTLEGKGLVRRLAHPTDARARQIVLTPAGQRMVRRAVARVEAVDDSFFASPGPELRALAAVLPVSEPRPAQSISTKAERVPEPASRIRA
jgi:DNA-binding MarR family transcriptional regulator